jgi:hypothetical protein
MLLINERKFFLTEFFSLISFRTKKIRTILLDPFCGFRLRRCSDFVIYNCRPHSRQTKKPETSLHLEQ